MERIHFSECNSTALHWGRSKGRPFSIGVMNMIDRKAIEKYHKRVDKRLTGRGVTTSGYRYSEKREDAAQRLAFGLCKKYGIKLPKGAGPGEAWAALKEKTGKGPMQFYSESGKAGSDKIKFATSSPKTFLKKLAEAKKAQDPRKGWRVTGMNMEDLKAWHPNAKLHVTDGGSTVALDDGDIIGVCIGPGDGRGGFQSGASVLEFAVKNGGNRLDSYSGNHEFYVKNGFEPVSWCKWDEQYEDGAREQGWSPENGDKREPIIFYKYVGKGNVQNKDMDEFMKKVKASKDYDEAKDVRDKNLGVRK